MHPDSSNAGAYYELMKGLLLGVALAGMATFWWVWQSLHG